VKKFLFYILSFFALASVTAMDNNTKNLIKSASFASFDEEDNYDDSYDDSYEEDNYTGKKTSKRPQGSGMPMGWVRSSGYFTVKVVNATSTDIQVELFNSLNQAANVVGTIQPTLNPFVFSNRAAANGNSTIVYSTTGSQIYTNSAGNTVTITCQTIAYRTLVESLKFYKIGISKMKINFTNDPQLDNDINFTERTFLGKVLQNSITPRNYFADNQFQSKQVTIVQPFILDGERGINFLCNSGETMSFAFSLDSLKKA